MKEGNCEFEARKMEIEKDSRLRREIERIRCPLLSGGREWQEACTVVRLGLQNRERGGRREGGGKSEWLVY